MDKKALDILFKRFWSASGWKRSEITLSDFIYAKDKGVMFDEILIDHSEIINWLISTFRSTLKVHIVKCFVSSLSSRRMDWRSGLSSFGFAINFPVHEYYMDVNGFCGICGKYNLVAQKEDLNILNFERLKWGGVRLTDPLFAAFNLSELNKIETPEPTKEDTTVLNDLIYAIRESSNTDRPGYIEKRWSKILKSNAGERRSIIDTFGICSILETNSHKGYLNEFIIPSKRHQRPVNKTDWEYPVDWWTGADGINEDALNFFFKEYLI